jgi:[ribosomal protein S5]-alanine N-acetyltransferase
VTATQHSFKVSSGMLTTPTNTVSIGESDRLLVRTWCLEDASEYLQLSQDEGFNHLSVRNYRQADLQSTQHWLQNEIENFRKYRLGTCAVIEKSSRRIVGVCALKRLHHEDKDFIETMYRFVKDSWGKGYATEAARLYLKYGFEKLKLDEIIGITVVENDPSRRVLEKLGMRWVRESTFSGRPVEIYSINQADWK